MSPHRCPHEGRQAGAQAEAVDVEGAGGASRGALVGLPSARRRRCQVIGTAGSQPLPLRARAAFGPELFAVVRPVLRPARRRVLEELLAAHRTPSADLQRRAVRAGIPLHNEVLVLAIEVDESAQRWAWLRATRIATDRSATVGTVGGRLVVIDADGDPHAAAAAWAAGIQSQGGARPTIGIATGAIGAVGIRAAHRDASAALSILLALERTGSSATSAELGFSGQMLVHARPGELAEFLGRTLGAVKAYDAERAAELLPTLDAVLTHEGHHANAARSLGIHVNTLYQRLERLDEVLGEGWRDSDRRLELHLAVRLHSVEQKLDRA